MTRELRTGDRPAGGKCAEFVVITGLSGAGRSEAAKVLEDLGYFTVIDNLPASLIGRVAELAVVGRDRTQVALVMDARGGSFTAGVSSCRPPSTSSGPRTSASRCCSWRPPTRSSSAATRPPAAPPGGRRAGRRVDRPGLTCCASCGPTPTWCSTPAT